MWGYNAVTAGDGEDALKKIKQESPDLVLLDLELPQLPGLDVLKQMRINPGNEAMEKLGVYQLVDPPVIVMTAYGDIKTAVDAMKLGAYDFLTKTFNFEHLSVLIQRSIEQTSRLKQAEHLDQEINDRYGTIVRESPSMKAVVDEAQRVASTSGKVLLLGETGTGKEILARHIHRWSNRHAGPFMAINCSAFTEDLLENELFGHEKGAFTDAKERQKGKIEAANGGTVFLDEIGDMPTQLQGRLLRLLQDQEFYRVGGTTPIQVNVRFIAATNKDLNKCIDEGTFREDLFYRLNIFSITVPPLRTRVEEIPKLVRLFLARQQKRALRLSPSALEAMMQYHWPGNIRELENVLERAALLSQGDEILPKDLRLREGESQSPQESTPLMHISSYRDSMDSHSRFLLWEALKQTGWNQTKAAEALKIHRSYFVRLMKRLRVPSSPPIPSK
ncbi:MAG: response regulator [Nitrospirales bacterium]|nr:response regulator [Nitrospirales bacterium]